MLSYRRQTVQDWNWETIRPVPNIRFEFEPDRIVGQMDYSYSAEYCHDLELEYG